MEEEKPIFVPILQQQVNNERDLVFVSKRLNESEWKVLDISGLGGLLAVLSSPLDLVMSNCPINADLASYLSHLLANAPSVSNLRAVACQMDDACMLQLLPSLTKIESLDLHGNHMTAAGAADAVQYFSQMHKLKHLDLAGNALGDDGIAAVCRAVAGLSQLVSLDISTNAHVTAAAAKAVADLVRKSPSLHSISWRWTRLETDGAVTLSRALVGNTTLHSLDLTGCTVGSEGAAAFVTALEKNQPLQSLLLHGTGATEEQQSAVSEAMRRNRALAFSRRLELSATQAAAAAAVAAAAQASKATPHGKSIAFSEKIFMTSSAESTASSVNVSVVSFE